MTTQAVEPDDLKRPIAELAAELGRKYPNMSYWRLYAAITSGMLPAERRGARWLATRRDAVTFIENSSR